MQIYTRVVSTRIAMSTEQSISIKQRELRLQKRQEQNKARHQLISSTAGGAAKKAKRARHAAQSIKQR